MSSATQAPTNDDPKPLEMDPDSSTEGAPGQSCGSVCSHTTQDDTRSSTTAQQHPNPLVVRETHIAPDLRWKCVVVVEGYKDWIKANPPILGFQSHLELLLPATETLSYKEFEKQVLDKLLLPSTYRLSIFWYDPTWGKQLQAGLTNWDNCFTQVRDAVLNGEAMNPAKKLDHSARISVMYLNFLDVTRIYNERIEARKRKNFMTTARRSARRKQARFADDFRRKFGRNPTTAEIEQAVPMPTSTATPTGRVPTNPHGNKQPGARLSQGSPRTMRPQPRSPRRPRSRSPRHQSHRFRPRTRSPRRSRSRSPCLDSSRRTRSPSPQRRRFSPPQSSRRARLHPPSTPPTHGTRALSRSPISAPTASVLASFTGPITEAEPCESAADSVPAAASTSATRRSEPVSGGPYGWHNGVYTIGPGYPQLERRHPPSQPQRRPPWDPPRLRSAPWEEDNEEGQLNKKYETRIRARDATLPWKENSLFRCSACFAFKAAFRYPDMEQSKPKEKRKCSTCARHERSTLRMLMTDILE